MKLSKAKKKCITEWLERPSKYEGITNLPQRQIRLENWECVKQAFCPFQDKPGFYNQRVNGFSRMYCADVCKCIFPNLKKTECPCTQYKLSTVIKYARKAIKEG